MRYLKLISFIALILLMIGSGTKEIKLTEGINPGNLAPELQLQGISFKENSYRLVQFWAAYDAESRAKNVKIDHAVAGLNVENLQLVSIAFDEKQSIFEETIKADGLDSSTQWNDSLGTQSDIYKTYCLDKGFTNILMNPEGVIIAKNIQPDQIKEYLR